tara:strand:+ start:20202 stop:21323 length:1122 start_codon:yes stop_codon:yes gene_type:complete
MSVQVSYKKQSILGLVILVIILSAVEGLLRIDDYYNNPCIFITSNIYPEIDYGKQKQMCNDYRDIAYLAGIDRHIEPNQNNGTIHINNFGMRGPDIIQDKPIDTFRIFVIGGSTVYGSGSTSDSTTIPGFLQQFFDNSEMSKKIQVINAGIEGSTSVEEVHRIKNDLIHFNPDIVVLYHGTNDAHLDWNRYTNHETFETTLEKKILFFFQTNLPEYKTPINSIYLINRIMGNTPTNLDNTISETYYKSEHMTERSLLWHDRLEESCKFGNENGFKTVVLLQPVLGTGEKPLTQYEKDFFSGMGGHENTMIYDRFANGLTGLDQHCNVVQDLRNIFDETSEFIYFDNAHMSDFGNEIVSERIFEILKPIVLEEM